MERRMSCYDGCLFLIQCSSCNTKSESKMVPKAWLTNGFILYGIPAHIHSDWDMGFDNHLIEQLCRSYGTGGSRLSQIFWDHENLSSLSIIQLITLL